MRRRKCSYSSTTSVASGTVAAAGFLAADSAVSLIFSRALTVARRTLSAAASSTVMTRLRAKRFFSLADLLSIFLAKTAASWRTSNTKEPPWSPPLLAVTKPTKASTWVVLKASQDAVDGGSPAVSSAENTLRTSKRKNEVNMSGPPKIF